MKYLKEAAESGVISAQHNLANEYMVGKNVEKDDIKAYAWFKQAAIQGFIYSKVAVRIRSSI